MHDDKTAAGGCNTKNATVTDADGNSYTDWPYAQSLVLSEERLDVSSGTVLQRTNYGYGSARTHGTDTYSNLRVGWCTNNDNLSHLWGTTHRNDRHTEGGGTRSTTTSSKFDPDGRLTREQVATTVSEPNVGAIPSYSAGALTCTSVGYAYTATTGTPPRVQNVPTITESRDQSGMQSPACLTGSVNGTQFTRTDTRYDGATNVASQAITKGDVTAVDAYTTTSTKLTTATTYDTYGRVLTVTNPRGKVTTTAYSAGHVQPIEVIGTNPLGHVTTTALDPRLGVPTTVTDANGNSTYLVHNNLGRLICLWLPGTLTTPSTTGCSTTSTHASKIFVYNLSYGEIPQVTTYTLQKMPAPAYARAH